MTGRFLLCLLLALGFVPPASAADVSGALARIQAAGVIRMGYLEAAPPFSFERGDRTPAGYSVDLCKAVAASIRDQLALPALRVEWVKLDLANRLAAVRSGKVDVECGTTTWTLSRQEMVDFSLMTFIDGATVLVRGDSAATRLSDLTGKRLAVVPGTTTEKALATALKREEITADVTEVSSAEQGLAMLSAGQVDGYASDRVVLLGLGLSAPRQRGYRLLNEDFSVEPYALTLPRGEYDLRLAVNRGLAALFRSGEIETVFSRWLAPLGKPSVLLSALYYLQGIPE